MIIESIIYLVNHRKAMEIRWYDCSLFVVVCLPRSMEELGDSNFQIFFTELPVPPQAAGVVRTFHISF